MEHKIVIGKSLGKIYRTVWKSLGKLMLFGLIYSLVLTLTVEPLMKLVFSLTMRIKGYPILINADIASFLKSIPGILVTIGIGILASITVYYEFSTMMHILKTSKRETPPSLLFSMEKAVFSLSPLKSKETIGFILYALFLLPILDMGMESTILPKLSIPNFVIGEITKHKGGEPLLALLVVAGTYLFMRLFYVLPVMVFEEQPFMKACRRSISLTKKNTFRTFVIATLTLLSAFIIMLVPTFIFFQLRGWIFLPFKAVSFLVLVVGGSLIPAMIMCASLTGYEQLVEPFIIQEEDLNVQTLDSNLRRLAKRILQWIQTLWLTIREWFRRTAPSWLVKRPYIILIVLMIPAIFLSDILIPLSFQQQEPIIVGHRGSLDGVENTKEAIQGAIDQGADFAEIDVLLSADNVPMVIHDANLLRLTGSSGTVYDQTAEELSTITLRNRGMKGKISTLDEICRFSKGKINLLIEYKTHGRETGSIVEETVEVVRKQRMEQDVKYQTLERPLFQEMKLKYPEYEMGFIIVGHIGKLSTRQIIRLGADFLGVEESQATDQLITAAHKAGTPIYVWTVNDAEEAQRFVTMEMDGIITDYPSEVKEALEEAKRLEP